MGEKQTVNSAASYDVAVDTLATGEQVQLVKLVDGTADSSTVIPGGANGLKVDPSSVTSPVSVANGSDVSQGAVADAAWSGSGSGSVIAVLKAIYAKVAGTLTVSGSLGRSWTLASGTDTVNVGNLPATQPVSGSVSVSNLPATQPVSGTVAVSNFPGTQPVSGPLTDTQLRATAVPVDASATTQPVSGSVNVVGTDGVTTGLPATVALHNSRYTMYVRDPAVLQTLSEILFAIQELTQAIEETN